AKSVCGGNPATATCIRSLSGPGTTRTTPRAYGRQLAFTAPAERTSGNWTAVWLLDASAACVPTAPDVGRLIAANAAAARDASAMRWNVRFMGFPLLVSFSPIDCLSNTGVAKPALIVILRDASCVMSGGLLQSG